jgi:ATP-dependent protease ClpP protease subunit
MWWFGKRKSPDLVNPEPDLANRIVRLDGPITDATAQAAIAQLLFLQHKDE